MEDFHTEKQNLSYVWHNELKGNEFFCKNVIIPDYILI